MERSHTLFEFSFHSPRALSPSASASRCTSPCPSLSLDRLQHLSLSSLLPLSPQSRGCGYHNPRGLIRTAVDDLISQPLLLRPRGPARTREAGERDPSSLAAAAPAGHGTHARCRLSFPHPTLQLISRSISFIALQREFIMLCSAS